MKKKEIQSWRAKSAKELETVIDSLVSQLVKLRMELKTNKLKNVKALTQKRHYLAVAKTILQEKKLGIEPLSEGKSK